MGERRNQQEEAHITEESFATNAFTKLYLKHTSALLHTLQDQRARSLQGCRQVPTLARGATKNHPKKTESIKHTDGITEIDDILENSGNANMIMRTQMDHEAKFMNLSRAPAHHGTPRRVWCYMWHPKDVATDTSTACRIREATRLLAYRNKQDATKMIRKINIQISRKVKQQIHLKISSIKIQKTGNNIMHTSKCKGSKPLDPSQLRQTGITCINCSADECRPSYASSVLAPQWLAHAFNIATAVKILAHSIRRMTLLAKDTTCAVRVDYDVDHSKTTTNSRKGNYNKQRIEVLA